MTRPDPPHAPPTTGDHLRVCAATALAALVLGVAAVGTTGWPRGVAAPPTGPGDKEPTIDGQPLFHSWPDKAAQKPAAAIVLTGQTFGLLQPCGCSRPQKGGLERRMQFVASLKAKGWPVAGVDLGDVYPEKVPLQDQGLLRYKTTMNALREMGYVAVGVGRTEFAVELDKVLGEYALQGPQAPYVLAGNVMGVVNGKAVPAAQHWPGGGGRPLIDLVEVAKVGGVTVGVAGIVGKSLAEEVEKKKLDPSITFEKNAKGEVNNAPVLARAVKALADKKTQLNVLLYQGTAEEAEKLALAWPQFHVILCQADDPEPPQFPVIPKGSATRIIQVGHKGRYAGVLGVFAKNGGFDLHYQIVPLEEYYITPGPEAAALKANPILPLLDTYAKTVRDTKTANGNVSFLEDWPRGVHAAQVAQPKLTYVGSDACKACHAAEHNVWSKTPHGHALETLEKVAKRPDLRHYDPECVRCHTVGFEYQTGYVNEKKSPNLKHVGCENCHGPGSGHAANPKAPEFLALMSPWRAKPGDKLPDALLKQLAAVPAVERGKIPVQPAQQLMINTASRTCAQCHDPDNDPHFDFPTYWPKVAHTGMAPPGGWPAVAPK